MKLKLFHPTKVAKGELTITGSKSESNRLLILHALYPQIKIENLSSSDDSNVTLSGLKSNGRIIDIHHAGTAMRFLTAYYAVQQGREVVLTGSKRMQERPIKLLVEALNSIGADIRYERKAGFPPLIIKGKELSENRIGLPANISSQYISALMLIAPSLKNGLVIELIGETTSVPYIQMTQSILNQLGFEAAFDGSQITIKAAEAIEENIWKVESDWSSASYYFSIAALSEESEIELNSYKEDSLQGDKVLREIYRELGVLSKLEDQKLVLKKVPVSLPDSIHWDLSKAPDIAQTIVVSCYGLGIGCTLVGLHTLKIKETDRLQALYNELTKLGATISITEESLHLEPGSNFVEGCSLPTYKDHRMAMAFAPLSLKVPLTIEDAEVVSKSYPAFWEDLKKINFIVQER